MSGGHNTATEDSMNLPPGKTCADCGHFRFCVQFIGPKYINDKATACDWAPSRFAEASR